MGEGFFYGSLMVHSVCLNEALEMFFGAFTGLIRIFDFQAIVFERAQGQ